MKAFKELMGLWDNLRFYVWMGAWRKANKVCGQINNYKQTHIIAYSISYVLSIFYEG